MAAYWEQLDNNPICSNFAASNGALYQLHNDGTIWRYTGPPMTGWQLLDNNLATTAITAAASELYQLHNDGTIWRYTGPPMTGWQLLDNNLATTAIVASGGALYQLHNDGTIWRYTGTPMTGWQLLDNNLGTTAIAAAAGELYHLHNDGTIWRYTGTPVTGWERLDNNSHTTAIAASVGLLYQRHNDGSIWRAQIPANIGASPGVPGRSDTFGGLGGASFEDSHDIETWGRITQIVVRYGSGVDSIGVAYANGNYISHGGTGGTPTTINLQPDEFIVRVDGRSGTRLNQITFYSNKRVYGPYGGNGGSPFHVDFHGKALLYLFGRSGSMIDQIGFGYGDPPPVQPSTIVRSAGHGGMGGDDFDDLSASGNVLGKIVAITVRHGSEIDNIKVAYKSAAAQHDTSSPAAPPTSTGHGGSGGNEETFYLDDNEWLTEVHGQSGTLLDQVWFVLSSGRRSKVYGGNGGHPFVEKRDNCVVKAFFGRSGSLVDQLGVYFEDAKPLSIEITSLEFDQPLFLAIPPMALLTTNLENKSSIQQHMTQKVGKEVEISHTTTIAETFEISASFTLSWNAGVTGGSETFGYKQGSQYQTGVSQTEKQTCEFDFEADVPPNSTIKATGIARQGTYCVGSA